MAACCQVTAITFTADAITALTSQCTADYNAFNTGFLNCSSQIICNFFVSTNQNFTCFRMNNRFQCITACNTFFQWFNNFIAVFNCFYQ